MLTLSEVSEYIFRFTISLIIDINNNMNEFIQFIKISSITGIPNITIHTSIITSENIELLNISYVSNFDFYNWH